MIEEARDLERRLGLAGLAGRLGQGLLSSADPERAARLATDVLAAAAPTAGLAEVWEGTPADVVRVLATLGGAAPFFAPILVREPEWLARLAGDHLATERSAADYAARLAAWLEAAPAGDLGASLRRFKYYELARITVRDLSPDLVGEERAGETLAELSHLADALLARALAGAAAELEGTVGPPCWQGTDGRTVRLGFSVLALGKLGSEELNYSSDVDLVYVYASPGGLDEAELGGGPGGLAPTEYFSRLALRFGRLASEVTADGFLYRIDLDLRPQGTQGPLVGSIDMLTQYYDGWAAAWEKAAFMKARPVAGDLALGWQVIRALSPMIYRSSMDLAGVEAIKDLKERIEQAKERAGATFHVKIGSGGIRDIEFVAQALQLLHGGRMPQVRVRSLQQALAQLEEVGVLPPHQCEQLLAGYRFLRRLENRLQMEAERQAYRLPADPTQLVRLARSMGFLAGDSRALFEKTLEEHRAAVRSIFAALFHEGATDRILKLFQRHVPGLFASETGRTLVEDLAGGFARAIEATPSPERAENNLDRFIQGVGTRRFYYELLFDRPELIPRLAALFSDSQYLSGTLATHPRLIEPIFSDPNVLLLGPAELRENLAEIRTSLEREERRDETELGLDALRLFHNRQLVNVGLLDLVGKVTPAEAEAGLSDVAEACVEGALALARAEMARRDAEPTDAARAGEFLVVAMGKLATRELTYGSDLDVIFLYDVAGADESRLVAAQEYFVRLAQKLIWALQTRTGEGVCYLIDARLRPSGRQGMLVTSIGAFDRYHATAAQVWERQALLRARPVAGGDRLARSFEAVRRRILGVAPPADLGPEIHRIRLRMESELAHETGRRRDFKTGRGGLLDVETVVQYLQLRHGAEHEELLAVDTTTNHLDRLERLGLLDPRDAHTLAEGWDFLQLLSSRLRIVENRSISDLDEERGDLDALALRLGYPPPPRAGGARRALLDDYRRLTGAIRDVYLRVLDVPGARRPVETA